MVTRKRVLLVVLLGALTIWAAPRVHRIYTIHFPDRNHAAISELRDTQTLCLGRYAVDLPIGSRLVRNEFGIDSIDMTELGNMSESDYHSLIEKRWRELEALTVDTSIHPPEPFTRPSQRLDGPKGATIFTFAHSRMHAENWPSGATGTQHFFETEGYLRQGERVFKFQGGRMLEAMERAMARVETLKTGHLPTTMGFCATQAFFPGSPAQGESINLAFELPDNGVQFRINYPVDPPPDRSAIHAFTSPDLHTKRIRSASRTLNGMKGRESIDSGTERKGPEAFESSIGAWWDFPGPLAQYPAYGIRVSLEHSVRTQVLPPQPGALPPAKVPSDVDEEKFLALWDGILATLRPIPGAQ